MSDSKEQQRYGFVVVTGRYKILDYRKPDGQQIATADGEEEARTIVRALSSYDVLVDAVTRAIEFIEGNDTYSTDPEVKAISDKLAEALALAEKES